MQSSTVWLVDIGFVVKVGSQRFRLDYVATEQWLRNRYGSVQSFLFNGYDPNYGIPDGLNRFYSAMRTAGMNVCLHPMSGRAGYGDHRQRRVDVDITAHLVWQSSLPEVERIVLTTGDQDFLPAVQIARREYGKKIALLCYDQDVSQDLKQETDEILYLDDIRNQVIRVYPAPRDTPDSTVRDEDMTRHRIQPDRAPNGFPVDPEKPAAERLNRQKSGAEEEDTDSPDLQSASRA